MEVTIEAYADYFEVRVNGRKIGIWTYLDGAIEAARTELLARYPYDEMSKGKTVQMKNIETKGTYVADTDIVMDSLLKRRGV